VTGAYLLAAIGITVVTRLSVNSSLDFVADRFYFDLSYGDRQEFVEQKQLPGSTIAKLDFKSILRVELPAEGKSYRGFTVPPLADTAAVSMNRTRTLVLAAFGEHAMILSPEFHLLKAYQNISSARWTSDDEITGTVEVGGPVSKYATAEFALNVKTERARRLGSW
jgi:hypothetical protein